MNKLKPQLKVVEGGKKDDGSSYACSALSVTFVIDQWKNGRKIGELNVGPVPILASDEGDSAFGFNIDKIAKQAIERVKSGDVVPPPANHTD